MSDPIKLALLGKNLTHSVSPELHQLLYKMQGRNEFSSMRDRSLVYGLVNCEAECDVAQWMKTATANGFTGANITRPYKELARRLATQVTPFSEWSDSVNTLSFSGDEVVGESTDGAGLLYALQRECGEIELSDMEWYIYGFGGAARSCLTKLLEVFRPRSLSIFVRTSDIVADTAKHILQITGRQSVPVQVVPFESAIEDSRTKFVLQTTPLGQKGYAGFAFSLIKWKEEDIAVDLVYNPLKTAFLQRAQQEGAMTMGGMGMLIEQAALAQCFWFIGRLPNESPLESGEYLSIKSYLTNLLS
jgi:shikimate dehydrogenase